MAIIKVASPAGSGMNFALTLLQQSFFNDIDHFVAAGHERSDILEDIPTIVILRNPIDTVTSGAERWLRSSNHLEFRRDAKTFEDTDIVAIVRQLCGEKARYLDFFRNIEDLKHVKLFTFDSLVEDPNRFVRQVAENFNIGSKITDRTKEYITKVVVDSDHANRIPREKSPTRILIDNLAKAMNPEEEWKIYLDLKEKIDKGLL